MHRVLHPLVQEETCTAVLRGHIYKRGVVTATLLLYDLLDLGQNPQEVIGLLYQEDITMRHYAGFSRLNGVTVDFPEQTESCCGQR